MSRLTDNLLLSHADRTRVMDPAHRDPAAGKGTLLVRDDQWPQPIPDLTQTLIGATRWPIQPDASHENPVEIAIQRAYCLWRLDHRAKPAGEGVSILRLVVANQKISAVKDLLTVLEKVMQTGKPVVVIAEDVEEGVW